MACLCLIHSPSSCHISHHKATDLSEWHSVPFPVPVGLIWPFYKLEMLLDGWEKGLPLALALWPASFLPQDSAFQTGALFIPPVTGLCRGVNLPVNFPPEVICTIKLK